MDQWKRKMRTQRQWLYYENISLVLSNSSRHRSHSMVSLWLTHTTLSSIPRTYRVTFGANKVSALSLFGYRKDASLRNKRISRASREWEQHRLCRLCSFVVVSMRVYLQRKWESLSIVRLSFIMVMNYDAEPMSRHTFCRLF